MDLSPAPQILDDLLDAHRRELGADRVAYGNHCHRVFTFAQLLFPEVDRELLAIACAFHDLGIWTEGTFDYLAPSTRLAQAHLRATGHDQANVDAVALAIEGHHKVTRQRDGAPLAEALRRADWTDVTFGWYRSSLTRAAVRAAYAAFPDAGFHGRLVALTWRRFLRHPLSPLPMLRW